MFSKVFFLFSFVILSVNCYSLNRNGLFNEQSFHEAEDIQPFNPNVRIIRQTYGVTGYQSQVQPRDQTVIVVPPSSGSNMAYRGVPTSTYGVNRAPTVVVSVPDNTYSRVGTRYLANPIIPDPIFL